MASVGTQLRSHPWRALFVLSVIALLAAHRPLLRTVLRSLVSEESWNSADCVLAMDGERCFQQAALRLKNGQGQRVLLMESLPSRVVRLGILPSPVEQARTQLAHEGISEASIEVIRGEPRTVHQRVEALGNWLADHPAARVTLLCPRLEGRLWRKAIDATLSPASADRVCVTSLHDSTLVEEAWWLDRNSAKQVLFSWLRLALGEPAGNSSDHTATVSRPFYQQLP